jgi:hypothetical protein
MATELAAFEERLKSRAELELPEGTARVIATTRALNTANASLDQLKLLGPIDNISLERIKPIEVKFDTTIKEIKTALFVIEEVKDGFNPTLTCDLAIDVGSGDIKKEQQELFVAINRVASVLRKACTNLAAPEGSIEKILNWLQPRPALEDPKYLLDQYLRKLARIARNGLTGGQLPLALLALDELRDEFVVQQAGRVKNSYIRRLAIASAGSLLFFCATYVVFRYSGLPTQLRYFALAAIGASVGTWLSFSVRRVTLAFNDLANLEADLLTPFYRLVFVIALTMTVCLLFSTGVLNITIGALKTDSFMTGSAANGWMISILVGILCGLSERAMATSVSARSASFVTGLGGEAGPNRTL